MSRLTQPRVYAALAAFHAADAVLCAVPIAPIKKALDDVNLAQELRPMLPVVKGAAAIGLLSVRRFPALARLTTFMLSVYFGLAVAFHFRARDWSPALVAASSFLALFTAMTAAGPDRAALNR